VRVGCAATELLHTISSNKLPGPSGRYHHEVHTTHSFVSVLITQHGSHQVHQSPEPGSTNNYLSFPTKQGYLYSGDSRGKSMFSPSLFFLLASLTLLDRHPTSPSHFISEPSLYRHSYQTRNRAPKSTRYAFSLCNFSPFLSPEPLGFFASSSSITRHLQM
jgi:hypothetical protein